MKLSNQISALVLLVSALVPLGAQANALDGLLGEVRQFSREDQQQHKAREAKFARDLSQQQQLLSQERGRLEAAELRQEELKASYDNNEDRLAELEETLRQRSGQLGEVFGVVKQNAVELQGSLQDSMVNAQFPERAEALAFAHDKKVPTLAELETLWFELQREMTESGKRLLFETTVIGADGQQQTRSVARIGTFTAVTEQGEYLHYQTEQSALQVLPKQPSAEAQQQAAAYVAGNGQVMLTDPTRGQMLALLDQVPTLQERIEQGGYVGYVILALGAIGLLVAAWRLMVLLVVESKVRLQLKRLQKLSARNPLGRVLGSAENSDLPFEQLEMVVDEAILREAPRLERGQNLIKLLAAVAPLLGLLGTVTGMIATFQSITIFGTSDPKLMAGGISTALMTTVMGLIVAIPLLFSHSLLVSRSRRLIQIMQEKSLAALANRSSQVNKVTEIANAA